MSGQIDTMRAIRARRYAKPRALRAVVSDLAVVDRCERLFSSVGQLSSSGLLRPGSLLTFVFHCDVAATTTSMCCPWLAPSSLLTSRASRSVLLYVFNRDLDSCCGVIVYVRARASATSESKCSMHNASSVCVRSMVCVTVYACVGPELCGRGGPRANRCAIAPAEQAIQGAHAGKSSLVAL